VLGAACYVLFRATCDVMPSGCATRDSRSTATVVPNTAGVAHVILAVTDNGRPSLTSYRRVILTIQGPAK